MRGRDHVRGERSCERGEDHVRGERSCERGEIM